MFKLLTIMLIKSTAPRIHTPIPFVIMGIQLNTIVVESHQ